MTALLLLGMMWRELNPSFRENGKKTLHCESTLSVGGEDIRGWDSESLSLGWGWLSACQI